jgi:hypothetical protein
MNDQDAPTTSEDPEQPSELPPIPDGGLAKAMPPWLAEPPSRPSKLAGDPTPLDLQTLAGSTELPRWLGDLSVRVDRDAGVILQDKNVPAVAAQDSAIEEIAEVHETLADQTTEAIEAGAIAAPVVAPIEPKPEPKREAPPVPRPLPEAKVDIAPERRPLSTYLLYLLVVVVIAALAAWLIWG